MTTENMKALLDACYQAKRVRELLPALPKGVSPSYIHYLDTIEELERRGVRALWSQRWESLPHSPLSNPHRAYCGTTNL